MTATSLVFMTSRPGCSDEGSPRSHGLFVVTQRRPVKGADTHMAIIDKAGRHLQCGDTPLEDLSLAKDPRQRQKAFLGSQ